MTTVNRTTRLIESDSGDYPLYLADLATRVNNTSFPQVVDSEILFEFGYEVVLDTEVPVNDVVTEGAPELRDGSWYRVWNARSFNETELSANLTAAKAALKAQAEAKRIADFEKGFPHQFGETIYHVQIRPTDRQNITALRIIAKEAVDLGAPFPINFRVYENVSVALTAPEMVAVANAALYKVSEGYEVIWTFKDQVDAATTIAELPVLPTELFTL
jgi:uncharacterized protein (DUF736 family)